MKILIFNWRDIRNPKSGGAEILTHEMAKRWVKKGHNVTQYSSFFSGAKKYEEIDGVSIVREGNSDARTLFFSVHFLAFLYYLKHKKEFDVVIDEIHGLPFFTPLYVEEKKIALICEVASNLWFKIYGPFFGGIGRLIEIVYLKFIYRNLRFVTISKSTENELVRNGIAKDKISVLPMGINAPLIKSDPKKNKIPTILYIGRLSYAKGIEDAIQAVYLLKGEKKIAKLKIIGRGEEYYTIYLKQLCKRLDIEDEVEFLGFVSEDEKFKVIRSSHILVSPSAKEGFGLTIPEAGSQGVPSVVYKSLGLLDIVLNNKTGIVCDENTPENLKKNIIKLLDDENFYRKLSEGAKKESLKYDWEKTAEKMLDILSN